MVVAVIIVGILVFIIYSALSAKPASEEKKRYFKRGPVQDNLDDNYYQMLNEATEEELKEMFGEPDPNRKSAPLRKDDLPDDGLPF